MDLREGVSGPEANKSQKSLQKVSQGRVPIWKVRKKSRKRSERSKNVKKWVLELFGPFSRLFRTFGARAGRLFRDFLTPSPTSMEPQASKVKWSCRPLGGLSRSACRDFTWNECRINSPNRHACIFWWDICKKTEYPLFWGPPFYKAPPRKSTPSKMQKLTPSKKGLATSNLQFLPFGLKFSSRVWVCFTEKGGPSKKGVLWVSANITRRPPDYSSDLCPPKLWSIWLFQGVFWACFLSFSCIKGPQNTPWKAI